MPSKYYGLDAEIWQPPFSLLSGNNLSSTILEDVKDSTKFIEKNFGRRPSFAVSVVQCIYKVRLPRRIMMLQRQLIWFSVKIQAIIRIEDVKDSGSCKLKGDVEEKCWPQQIKLDVSTLLFRASKFPSLAYFSFTTDHNYFINTFNAHFFVWKENLRVPELIFVVHLKTFWSFHSNSLVWNYYYETV